MAGRWGFARRAGVTALLLALVAGACGDTETTIAQRVEEDPLTTTELATAITTGTLPPSTSPPTTGATLPVDTLIPVAAWEAFLADELGWGLGANLGDASTPRSVEPTVTLLIAYGSSPRASDDTAPVMTAAEWSAQAYPDSGMPSPGIDGVEEFFRAHTSQRYELDVEVVEVDLSTGHCNDGLTMKTEATQDLFDSSAVDLASYDADGDGTVRTPELRVVFLHDCLTDFGTADSETGTADGVAYRINVAMASRANETLTTFFHELFHQFSAKDVYPTSEGPRCNGGCFGLTIMHNTNAKTPPLLLDGAHRFAFGWTLPRVAHTGDGSLLPVGIYEDISLLGGGGVGTSGEIRPAETSAGLSSGAFLVFGDEFPDGYWLLEVRNDRDSGAVYDLRPDRDGKRGIIVWRALLDSTKKLGAIDNNSPAMVVNAGMSPDWLGDNNDVAIRAWTPDDNGTLRIPLVVPTPSRPMGQYSGFYIEISDWRADLLRGVATLRASGDE